MTARARPQAPGRAAPAAPSHPADDPRFAHARELAAAPGATNEDTVLPERSADHAYREAALYFFDTLRRLPDCDTAGETIPGPPASAYRLATMERRA